MNTVLSLQDPEAAGRYYKAGHWRAETMYMVLRRHALATPDRFALRDSVNRLTYGEVLAWVDALAEDMHGNGVRPGQRLSVWLPSRAESVIILLACSRMGYVANTSLHRDYTSADVIALLERARSAALFTIWIMPRWSMVIMPSKILSTMARVRPSASERFRAVSCSRLNDRYILINNPQRTAI